MGQDEIEIRALLATREKAIRDRDADAVIACTAPSLVTFDLQPPLSSFGAAARSARDLNAWFASWQGPIDVTTADPAVLLDGDLAAVFGLTRLKGVSVTDGPHESWFRSTFVLAKVARKWLIRHEHHSYPTRMDGTLLAATDLHPDSSPRID